MQWNNPKELIEYVRTFENADSTRLAELEARDTVSANYYHGKQWRRVVRRSSFDATAGVARLDVNYDVDSRHLRVTRNRTNQHVQKASVATFVERMEVQCTPPDRYGGPEATSHAQLIEDVIMYGIDATSFVSARRHVNFMRSVFGSAGCGFRARAKKKKLKLYGTELELPDTEITAFNFGAHQLVLDPFVPDRDLDNHEVVILREVWSARKIRERLGIEIDESKLKKIGDLALFETSVADVSNNEIYPHYRQMSETKGARVRQMHVCGENGRFDTMFVLVDVDPGNDGAHTHEGWFVPNWDNPASPFGGNGLPLALYHGHRRVDGPMGVGEAEQLKDDQDGLNIGNTWMFRQGLASAGWKILADRRSLGSESDPESFENEWNNMVGGVTWWNSSQADNNVQKPEVLKLPPPDAFLVNMIRMYEADMIPQIHRSEIDYGRIKTHQADASIQTASESSAQVLGARVVEDLATDAKLLRVLGGTIIKQVQSMSPCTLKRLQDHDFSEEDLAALFEADPSSLRVTIRIPEGSVRYTSPNQKRAQLLEALVNKGIAPLSYRAALAKLDSALTDDDKFFERAAELSALRVLRGEEWVPLPLGEYSEWLLQAFRRALWARLADDAAKQRLSRAIVAQRALMAQEMAELAGAQQAAAGNAQPEASLAANDEAGISFQQVLDQLGGGVPLNAA